MGFDFSTPLNGTLWWMGAALAFVIFVLGVILLGRLGRAHYSRIRERRAQYIRQNWEKIISGEIPRSQWFCERPDREIVEATALDRMEVATSEEAAQLSNLFRTSGLLDWHKNATRKGPGWRRRAAILTLGRMGAVEAVPGLIDAVKHSSHDISLAAIRALGRIGTPEAGAGIIRSLNAVDYPTGALESALENCFRSAPKELLVLTLDAADSLRPLLTRVLAAVSVPGMPGELVAFTSDRLAEVRASAARILAIVRPAGAVDLLTQLARDPEWFVRIRTMVALKEVADPFTIPVLMQGLCDRNRLVRLRAAAALAAMEGKEQYILSLAARTNDQYALQSLISEMERSGKISRMVDSLVTGADPNIERALLTAFRAGAVRLLMDLGLLHPNPLVQTRLLNLMARSKRPSVLQCLEQTAVGDVQGVD